MKNLFAQIELDSFSVSDLQAFRQLARSFAQAHLQSSPSLLKWILLIGDLGTGKTEWVKSCVEEISQHHGPEVSSPTYTYHQRYHLASSANSMHSTAQNSPLNPIDHFDLYRIEDSEKAEALGILETLAQSRIAFIEWPQCIEDFICSEALSREDLEIYQIEIFTQTSEQPKSLSEPSSSTQRQIKIYRLKPQP